MSDIKPWYSYEWWNECVESLQTRITDLDLENAKLRAENQKLRAFVEDSYCDCEDEYGDKRPYQCERCNLLGQMKGGEA